MAARSRKTYFYLIIPTLILFAGGILTGLFAVQADDKDTVIRIDQNENIIRLYVAGDEMAVIDDTGMHIRGNLTYNGFLMDGTPVHLKQGEADE